MEVAHFFREIFAYFLKVDDFRKNFRGIKQLLPNIFL